MYIVEAETTGAMGSGTGGLSIGPSVGLMYSLNI